MFGPNTPGTMQVLSENLDAKVDRSDPLKEVRQAYEKGDYQVTVDKATAFIKDHPHTYAAWVLRGAALSRMDSHYSAILNFTKAISINPNIYDAWNNRGLSYFRLCFWQEAVDDFEKAISLNADNYVSHFQLGLLYSVQERPVEAEFHMREAARKVPEIDYNHILCNIFLATLLQGTDRWEEGFKRDQNRFKLERQKLLSPVWKGEDLNGKHLLAFTEAGWGDKILSLRYIDYLFEKYPGVKITVGTQRDLVDIIRSTFGDRVGIITTAVKTDYTISLLDVPMVHKLSWDTVPRPIKYLTIEAFQVEKWKQRFANLPKGINVGLCWASWNGISKTIPPWDMVELGGVPGVNYISLQKPYRQCPKELKLIDWTDEINDWTDTGAIIENCDIIISVDTGVAHMAGALGKPVWNIIRYSTYWPWMKSDIPPSPEYSIWYPSMTLFRQRAYADWMDSIRRVTLALMGQLAGLT